MARHLPSIHDALGSIPVTTKIKYTQKEIKKGRREK